MVVRNTLCPWKVDCLLYDLLAIQPNAMPRPPSLGSGQKPRGLFPNGFPCGLPCSLLQSVLGLLCKAAKVFGSKGFPLNLTLRKLGGSGHRLDA